MYSIHVCVQTFEIEMSQLQVTIHIGSIIADSNIHISIYMYLSARKVTLTL